MATTHKQLAAELRFLPGFEPEEVSLGDLDGRDVKLEVFTDAEDILHIKVWDTNADAEDQDL